MELSAYLNEKRQLLEDALRKCLPEPQGPATDLIKAMRYSLFAGGKRLRPILCLGAVHAVGGEERDVLPVACALELIHTYSLIHDDLPVMDNDDLRRGIPTSHRVFGEAVALLAGDALLTEAFHLMSSMPLQGDLEPEALLHVISLISRAAGSQGMVGGQFADIQSEAPTHIGQAGQVADLSTVQFIHTRKTGALITASVVAGTILGGGGEREVQAMTSYGEGVGLAFQISDDILDIEGSIKEMGKGVGGDEAKGKCTYPSVLGLSRSKEVRQEMVDLALQSLEIFDHRADPLRYIARYIIERKK